MVHSREILPFGSGFVTWDFLDTKVSRLKFLQLNYRERGVPVGQTAAWVEQGGLIPAELELEEPRRKPYC